jgi:hypothetical protein
MKVEVFDKLYTFADRVGQFGARGILCESMEFQNTPNTLRSNQAELREFSTGPFLFAVDIVGFAASAGCIAKTCAGLAT